MGKIISTTRSHFGPHPPCGPRSPSLQPARSPQPFGPSQPTRGPPTFFFLQHKSPLLPVHTAPLCRTLSLAALPQLEEDEPKCWVTAFKSPTETAPGRLPSDTSPHRLWPYKRHPKHHRSPPHSSWPPTSFHFASSVLSAEGINRHCFITIASSSPPLLQSFEPSVRTAPTPSPFSCHRGEFWGPVVPCGEFSAEPQPTPLSMVSPVRRHFLL
jgi:hypothetical protein